MRLGILLFTATIKLNIAKMIKSTDAKFGDRNKRENKA